MTSLGGRLRSPLPAVIQPEGTWLATEADWPLRSARASTWYGGCWASTRLGSCRLDQSICSAWHTHPIHSDAAHRDHWSRLAVPVPLTCGSMPPP